MKFCVRLNGVTQADWTTIWATKNWTARIQTKAPNQTARSMPGPEDVEEKSALVILIVLNGKPPNALHQWGRAAVQHIATRAILQVGRARITAPYLAFRELRRVLRSEFMLNYISDVELRRVISGAMTKSEDFNRFVQWVAFCGQVLAENHRGEQRKLIKYNHLMAKCLIFFNVCAMTRVLDKIANEGLQINTEVLRRLSPYQTRHVNRFGEYRSDLNRQPPPINYPLPILTL